MKLLGMIGGTSWHSTVEYYRMINQLAVVYSFCRREPLQSSITKWCLMEDILKKFGVKS